MSKCTWHSTTVDRNRLADGRAANCAPAGSLDVTCAPADPLID